MKLFRLHNEGDTEQMAQVLARLLTGGHAWGLSGDLGAGKTTLVRHLIAAAGGDTRAVASPTYTLEHEYRLPNGTVVAHWDLYRLTTLPPELEERPKRTTVRVIEWPERCPEIQRWLDLSIQISHSHGSVESSGWRTVAFSGPLSAQVEGLLSGVISQV